jgi:plasmid stabilization system protein ParE
MSSRYALHPEAFADLDDIRDYIAQENPDAADRVNQEWRGNRNQCRGPRRQVHATFAFGVENAVKRVYNR